MHKLLLLAVTAIVVSTTSAGADNGSDLGWADGVSGQPGQSGAMQNSAKTDSVNFYVPQTANGAPETAHRTGLTSQQMTTGGLETSMGGPMIIFGRNTYYAPSNIALQTEKGAKAGKLPRTTFDSFVYNSGYNDHIYGDEGTEGPPPYSSFSTIGSGGVTATTGHPSDCPSAWY
jgi:hypothetical protein